MNPATVAGVDPITLRYDARPWTANSARAARHWSVNSSRTAEWRMAFAALARSRGLTNLPPCRITVTPYLASRRSRQDVAACAPAAKAAIDGVTDAGAWPDDDPRHVVELVFRAPVFGEGDGLELTLSPVAGPQIHTR